MGVQKSNDGKGTWNYLIYEAMGKDIDKIEEMKASLQITGDFNGHISNEKDGIKGNNPSKNRNGERLLSFCNVKQLKIMNATRKTRGGKESNFCKGLWTWQRGEHKSIIDYCLVNQRMVCKVRSVTIDSKRRIPVNSDHNWIITTIKANLP